MQAVPSKTRERNFNLTIWREMFFTVFQHELDSHLSLSLENLKIKREQLAADQCQASKMLSGCWLESVCTVEVFQGNKCMSVSHL